MRHGVTRLPLALYVYSFPFHSIPVSMGKVRVQKIRLKDLGKPPPTSSTSNDLLSSSPSTSKLASLSVPKTPSFQGACAISTAEFPKVIKVDANDLARATAPDARTILRADEISKDGQRLSKRHLDVSDLSPVKRRREAIARGRSLAPVTPECAPLSNTLQAVLDDFGSSGFHFVPDSREVIDVQALMASAAVNKQGRRRYLASVSRSLTLSVPF